VLGKLGLEAQRDRLGETGALALELGEVAEH
jgi:hypothetical protein